MSDTTIVFLGTGGTIAGLAASSQDNVSYKAAQVGIDLLMGSAGLQAILCAHTVEAEQVFQLDSKDMAFAAWQQLLARVLYHLARPEVASVVITHGTDTLEETAYFLHRVLPRSLLNTKAVVLTCAMRPASSANADGPANLCDAASVAVSPLRSGVLVVCGGTVHSALRVQKVHPYRLNPFDSGDAGPVGYVEEGVFRCVAQPVYQQLDSDEGALENLCRATCPRVEIVLSHADSCGHIVRALCRDAHDSGNPLAGIVVAGTGNGTMHHALEMALRDAMQAGIRVVVTSRCLFGEVVASAARRASDFPTSAVSAVKARIDLILALLMGAAQ